MPHEKAFYMMRIGSIAAILGPLLAGIGNLLHPVTPRDDPDGVARVIAGSDAWTLIHLIIVLGLILMLAGLLGLRYSINKTGQVGALTHLGMYAATVGTALGVVTVILDGVAAKQLADQWAAAPEASQAVALAMVSANETINFALAGMFNACFAGVTFVLFGLAVTRADGYPRWLGWVAYGAGVGSIAAGLFQALTGRPTMASLVLKIIGPTVITVWLLVMGVLMWRRTIAQPTPVGANRSSRPAL